MPDPAATTPWAIEASDRPLRPDQYTFVETHAWWLGSFGRHHHLTEHRLRQWVPARPERDWLLVRELTGAQRWLTGSADEAAADGFDLRDIGPVGRFQAPYGDFHPVDSAPPDNPCPPPPSRRGTWQTPTPDFVALLPRDPDALRARLSEENPGSWFGPFTAAVTALRTCLLPADLRAALYRALSRLPAVTVAAGVRNVDGRECLTLVHDAGRTRTELMVDPDDGQFAGERDTLRTNSRAGLDAGTVICATAVTSAVVDALGEHPRSARA